MTTPDIPTITARLEEILADFRATQIPVQPPLTGAHQRSREQEVDMLASLLEPFHATPEEVALARREAEDLVRQGEQLAERERTHPHQLWWQEQGLDRPPPDLEIVPPPKKNRRGSR